MLPAYRYMGHKDEQTIVRSNADIDNFDAEPKSATFYKFNDTQVEAGLAPIPLLGVVMDSNMEINELANGDGGLGIVAQGGTMAKAMNHRRGFKKFYPKMGCGTRISATAFKALLLNYSTQHNDYNAHTPTHIKDGTGNILPGREAERHEDCEYYFVYQRFAKSDGDIPSRMHISLHQYVANLAAANEGVDAPVSKYTDPTDPDASPDVHIDIMQKADAAEEATTMTNKIEARFEGQFVPCDLYSRSEWTVPDPLNINHEVQVSEPGAGAYNEDGNPTLRKLRVFKNDKMDVTELRYNGNPKDKRMCAIIGKVMYKDGDDNDKEKYIRVVFWVGRDHFSESILRDTPLGHILYPSMLRQYSVVGGVKEVKKVDIPQPHRYIIDNNIGLLESVFNVITNSCYYLAFRDVNAAVDSQFVVGNGGIHWKRADSAQDQLPNDAVKLYCIEGTQAGGEKVNVLRIVNCFYNAGTGPNENAVYEGACVILQLDNDEGNLSAVRHPGPEAITDSMVFNASTEFGPMRRISTIRTKDNKYIGVSAEFNPDDADGTIKQAEPKLYDGVYILDLCDCKVDDGSENSGIGVQTGGSKKNIRTSDNKQYKIIKLGL